MAEEMKGAHWDRYGPKSVNASIKYPWDKWLNGSMWLLVQGDDFSGKTRDDTTQFQRYLLTYAAKHNIKVKTKKAENGRDLYVKAFANTTNEGQERSRHFRAMKRRRQGLKDGTRYRYESDLPEDSDVEE